MNLSTILFVTMSVDAPGKNYDNLLECWLKQMRYHKIPNVAVMMGQYNARHTQLSRQHNARVIPVKPYSTKSTEYASYKWQGTKVNLFNLTEWQTIVYFDMDFIFHDSPKLCIPLCRHTICAVQDRYWMIGKRKGYFNAGMLIIRPSAQLFDRAKRAIEKSPPMRFAEQDILNRVFKPQLLPRLCNVLGPSQTEMKVKRGLLHEKLWLVPAGLWPSSCVGFT